MKNRWKSKIHGNICWWQTVLETSYKCSSRLVTNKRTHWGPFRLSSYTHRDLNLTINTQNGARGLRFHIVIKTARYQHLFIPTATQAQSSNRQMIMNTRSNGWRWRCVDDEVGVKWWNVWEWLGCIPAARVDCNLEEWEHGSVMQYLTYGRSLHFRSGLLMLSCVLFIWPLWGT